MSRIYDALKRAERMRGGADRPGVPNELQVLTVANNKGGVGKSTVAANLAYSLKRLVPERPLLLLGLDDQLTLDTIYANGRSRVPLSSALLHGDLREATTPGRFGVEFIAADREVSRLNRRGVELDLVRQGLEASGRRGLVVIDTKSDFEPLTQSAIAAADLTLIPVKDQPSLQEAQRIFELFDSWGRSWERARVFLSLIDRRVRFQHGEDVLAVLVGRVRALGLPLLQSFFTRSPKVEALALDAEGMTQPLAQSAPGAMADNQLRVLGQDVEAVLVALRAMLVSADEWEARPRTA